MSGDDISQSGYYWYTQPNSLVPELCAVVRDSCLQADGNPRKWFALFVACTSCISVTDLPGKFTGPIQPIGA